MPCAPLHWQRELRAQVEELHETQPECRVYIVLTKCDQLPELPILPGLGWAAHPDPPAAGTPGGGSDDSSNGALLARSLAVMVTQDVATGPASGHAVVLLQAYRACRWCTGTTCIASCHL